MKQEVESPGDENDEVRLRSQRKQLSRMLLICRELFFLVAFTLTAYATVINVQTKTRKSAPPTPFFHESSVVEDFYNGELHNLMRSVSAAGISFVMYYAPWDADCQDLRDDFEEVAETLNKQVYFAGVNCWEPGSECRNTFKNLPKFPQLIGYVGHSKAVEYRGPYNANHIIKFIDSILYPITVLKSPTHLMQLRFIHDAVVVAYLKFESPSRARGHSMFYEIARLMATKDHSRSVAFAMFTHEMFNEQMHIQTTPSIVLYLWNKQLLYTGVMSREAIFRWINAETSGWLADMNSGQLLPHMKAPGAALVMFTPRNPLNLITPYYHLMRRIAMQFYNCGNSTIIDPFWVKFYSTYSADFVKVQDFIRIENAFRLKCNKIKKWDTQTCVTMTSRKWDNSSCYDFNQFCPNLRRGQLYTRSAEVDADDLWEDPRSASALIHRDIVTRCSIMERTTIPPSPTLLADEEPVDIPMNACEFNQTVTFLVLDSNIYGHLARGLGLDLSNSKHNTAVVLITTEEAFKIKETENVTEPAISRLLSQYMSGERKRMLRSTVPDLRSSVRNNFRHPENVSSTVSVLELSTESFHRVALDQTMNVVVLFYSTYCGMCQGVSHTFLTVKYLLSSIPNLVLARIDGEAHDLPWHYTVHTYPSIIIFPAYRKSDSRVFPLKKAVTVYSLSQFIFANLLPEERVQGMLAFCSRWGNNPEDTIEGDQCIREVRIECLESISNMLKTYRSVLVQLRHSKHLSIRHKYKSTLKNLLKRLEYLKKAHLYLGHTNNIKASLNNLLNNWSNSNGNKIYLNSVSL